MTLLAFARGPAYSGCPDHDRWNLLAARRHLPVAAAVSVRAAESVRDRTYRRRLYNVLTRFVPRRTFWPRIAVSRDAERGVSYRIVDHLLGGAPHIQVIHQVTGLTWPNLPKGLIVTSAA